ncbi:hypothetical protein JL49_13250 [Pseudoalteromonas luteoviolacea]|nr:hypothetical protein JL49_13250 [Pseudoalteromonas luteoviolacea]
MTAILYSDKHKQIACDALTSEGKFALSQNTQKWKRLNDGSLIFSTGQTVDIHDLLTHLNGGELSPHINNVQFIRLYEGEVYYGDIHQRDDSKIVREEPLEFSHGIGTGGVLAMVALSCDKSPKEAIKIASQHDLHTNDNVTVFCTKSGERI